MTLMMTSIKVFGEGLGLNCDGLGFVLMGIQHYNPRCCICALASNGHFDSVALNCKRGILSTTSNYLKSN